jgi:hypothetical protein
MPELQESLNETQKALSTLIQTRFAEREANLEATRNCDILGVYVPVGSLLNRLARNVEGMAQVVLEEAS